MWFCGEIPDARRATFSVPPDGNAVDEVGIHEPAFVSPRPRGTDFGHFGLNQIGHRQQCFLRVVVDGGAVPTTRKPASPSTRNGHSAQEPHCTAVGVVLGNPVDVLDLAALLAHVEVVTESLEGGEPCVGQIRPRHLNPASRPPVRSQHPLVEIEKWTHDDSLPAATHTVAVLASFNSAVMSRELGTDSGSTHCSASHKPDR